MVKINNKLSKQLEKILEILLILFVDYGPNPLEYLGGSMRVEILSNNQIKRKEVGFF